ncbi:MAG: AAA family ATPase, partial [bacterium]|nr:AAA family ATPase [bacterium]
IALWMQRIGLNLNRLIGSVSTGSTAAPEWLTNFFELKELPAKSPTVTYATIRKQMAEHIEEINIAEPVPSGTLWQNLTWLSYRLQLTETEQQLVIFILCQFEYPSFRYVLAEIPTNGLTDAYRKLAIILELDVENVRQALDVKSILARLGFISHHHRVTCVQNMIQSDVLLTETLCAPHASEDAMLQHFATPAELSKLTAMDFRHLGVETEMIMRSVQSAVVNGTNGVNILLYGAPGSGKTELARVIAKELGYQLYAVGAEQASTGTTMSGDQRLSAYTTAQLMLVNHGQAMMLFDECEDVFVHEFFMHSQTGSIDYSKAWMNRLLESNRVPTIWICNRVGQIDPAYRRRFDLVLRMIELPTATRHIMVEQRLAQYGLSETLKKTIAALPKLLPYHIDKLERTLISLPDNNEKTADQCAGIWLRENASLFEASRRQFTRYADGSSAVFNAFSLPFDWQNLSMQRNDRVKLTNLLACESAPASAIMITGPSGSGKSTAAAQLAQHFNAPLMPCTLTDVRGWITSDIENNIQLVFYDATNHEAVLVMEDLDLVAANIERTNGRQIAKSFMKVLRKCISDFEGMVIATVSDSAILDASTLTLFGCQLALTNLSNDQNQQLFEELCSVTLMQQRPLVKTALEKVKLFPGDYIAALKLCRDRAMGLSDTADISEAATLSQDIPSQTVDPRYLLSGLKVRHNNRQAELSN